MVQAKLKLNHLTPHQILTYVMSAKGMFGKTAGCFNLLARDVMSSKKLQDFTKTKPVNLRSPVFVKEAAAISVAKESKSLEPLDAGPYLLIPNYKPKTIPKITTPSPALKNLDRLLQKKPENQQSSFWSSTPGRKAMSALVSVKPKIDQGKENAPNDDTSREVSVGKKARRESAKPGKNSWRRSVMPLPRQKRVGRLKRVDVDVGQL